MPLNMRGQTGQLKYGYQVAAQLGAWTSEDGLVKAQVTSVNAAWIDERPLSLWLTVGAKAWVWTDAVVQETSSPAIVQVSGKPEVRDIR